MEDRVVIDRNLVHGSRARRTIFVHGGVAGLANVELTPEFAARLGSAWGSALAPGSTVAANRDETRPARMFKRALMSGLASVGIRTIDIGAMPFSRRAIRHPGLGRRRLHPHSALALRPGRH